MKSHDLPLGRLYGPAWLNGDLWSPGFKCVWTAEKDQSGHHCPDQECDGEIKTRCYDRLHVAFCLCIITMTNGHQRFCGHRFQAESPKACASHGWGDNGENRVFQRAKKGLSFKLPEVIPHEKPGWEMVINGLGGGTKAVHICMGLIDGEQCFVRVLSRHSDGQPDQVAEIARVKAKELLLTETDREIALRDDGATSYQKYAAFNKKLATAGELQDKIAKKDEERTAKRPTPGKGGKKRAQYDKKSYKRLIKGKKN